MRSNLTADMLAEFEAPAMTPVMLAELFFDAGTLRIWTGYGTIEFDGNEYIGSGNLIGISPVKETQEVEAEGIVCTLSGVPSTLVALALGEPARGRPFRLYLGSATSRRYIATETAPGVVLTEGGDGILLENQLVDSPYRIFSGQMDNMEITASGSTFTIRLSVENALIIGRRNKIRRYTNEDQQKRYPGDKGLEFINQLQDKEIVW